MKAIIVPEFGDANVLRVMEIEPPQQKTNQMLMALVPLGSTH